MDSTKLKGDIGEVVAIKYLQKNGYQIKDTNYKFGRFGEIDVIALKDGIFYFIEVKFRSNNMYGSGEESITKSKLYKLEKSIYAYCMKNRVNLENISFDVIIVTKGQTSFRVKHYKNLEMR
ncbi:MAG: YraN family protein [Candidatus Gracilibacteria bacterium]|nr:YraN family protein [Candidatus Gracilibacteria bacterium]